MQYLPNTNILCLTYDEFVREGICDNQNTYGSLRARQQIKTHGRGGNGQAVLIEYETMRQDLKDKVRRVYGDVYEYVMNAPLLKWIRHDVSARRFYAEYKLGGKTILPLEAQQKYARQAEWLNMLAQVMEDRKMLRDLLKISMETFWERVIKLHPHDVPVNPCLPETYDNLRRKLAKYREGGYEALIEKRYGNQNSRKVSPKIENLIISLCCMEHKPYLSELCLKYAAFMAGKLTVTDVETGEVFDPKEFYVKGKPYVLGETTVDYYVKKPANIAMVDRQRMSGIQWSAKYKPAVMRKAPVFAFSKITMDDMDIPFKDHAGERPVKSYLIFDVASGAVVGKAFSLDKDTELLRAALRDMVQLILCNGWGMPHEVEMERHLTQNLMGGVDDDGVFINDILTEGVIFPNVRICLGGNAREKRAEHFIRQFKYGFENKRPGFQGRFYARMVTNRLNQDRDKTRYTYEQIVQNLLDDIEAYNNSLHPNQEQYPNLSRWEVLENYQNPNLVTYPAESVMPFVGFHTKTSLSGGYVKVQYNKYVLPQMEALKSLVNWDLDAYYIPSEYAIEKVYLYQKGKFICEAKKVEAFQEAVAEQTDNDRAIAAQQYGYQAQFMKMVKDRKSDVAKVVVNSTGESGASSLQTRTSKASSLQTRTSKASLLQTRTSKESGSGELIPVYEEAVVDECGISEALVPVYDGRKMAFDNI